jgi:hypothetical protein
MVNAGLPAPLLAHPPHGSQVLRLAAAIGCTGASFQGGMATARILLKCASKSSRLIAKINEPQKLAF